MKKRADAKFRVKENAKSKTRMHERLKNSNVQEIENAKRKNKNARKAENQIVRAVENAKRVINKYLRNAA